MVVCVYIDDTLVIGDDEAVREFKSEIRKFFSSKEEGEMTEYVGCMLRKTDDAILLHFGDKAKKMRNYRTKKVV